MTSDQARQLNALFILVLCAVLIGAFAIQYGIHDVP